MMNKLRLLLLSSLLLILGCRDAKGQAFQPFGNFGGHTYYISTAQDNWIASHLKALNAGLILAHISSAAENTFVNDSVKAVAWIGLGTGLNFNGNNADLTNYRWSDSVADVFMPFGTIFGVVQPDNANGTQRCVVINSANCIPAGSWDDTEPNKEFVSVAEGPLCDATVTLNNANLVLGCGTGPTTATLIASTGIFFPQFAWSGSGASGLNSLTNDTVIFTPTAAGTYTLCVTVSNPNSGCTTQVCKDINVTDIFVKDCDDDDDDEMKCKKSHCHDSKCHCRLPRCTKNYCHSKCNKSHCHDYSCHCWKQECHKDHDKKCKKDKTKVTICHVPPSHDMTKQIPVSALGGHLGHGDYCGPCKDAQARMIYSGEVDPVRVYPNPTNGYIYIDVPESATVNLLDLQGRVIETQNVDRTAQFNLDGHSAGMYFIEVNYDGERFRTKVIKQ